MQRVSIGYVLARPAQHEGRRLWTISGCVADLVPGPWSLRWVALDESERRRELERFGIAAGRLDELVGWCTELEARAGFVWPETFVELDDAREFARRFEPVDVSVTPATSAGLLAAIEGERIHPRPRLQAARAPAAGGVALGWDVVGVEEDDSLHTWWCNALVEPACTESSVQLAAHGLLAREEDAERVAAFCNDPKNGATPGPWFAAALERYEP